MESLESRIVLDCSALVVGAFDFEDSPLVNVNENGVLWFGGVSVDGGADGQDYAPDDTIVSVGGIGPEWPDSRPGRDVSLGQVRELLHSFANSGTANEFMTLDLRYNSWGRGSGSAITQFESYMLDQLDLADSCKGLRFAGPVGFEYPGEGGEYFTGGFLHLNADGSGDYLHSGDIVSLVTDYTISVDSDKSTLSISTQFGVTETVGFEIKNSSTLVDSFGQVWQSDTNVELIDAHGSPYEGLNTNGVDTVLGDIDGDGFVNFADFLVLSSNYGTSASEGDLNDDGAVDFADFLILAGNFGN